MTRCSQWLLVLLLGVALPVEAQNSRSTLLRQASAAYEGFETTRALDLARASLDPALGTPDSAWTQGVHLLLQVLIENGEADLARTWARWAMRVDDRMTLDSVRFVSAVTSMLAQARADVGARNAADDQFRESWVWVWPARGSSATEGQVRLDPSSTTQPLNVAVVNASGLRVGALVAGQSVTLAPGTYEIQVTAQGFIPARVSREVLPGVTLVFSPRLVPVQVVTADLDEPTRQMVYRSTLGLSVGRFGAPTPACAVATVAGGRLALTSYTAIRGATRVSATRGDGTPMGEVEVAAYDAPSDLAVLYLRTPLSDSLATSPDITAGQDVWGITLGGCRAVGSLRSEVAEWRDRPLGALALGTAITGTALGAPIVDARGRMVGLWSADSVAVPAPNAATLLELARRNAAAQRTLAFDEVARRENHLYGSVAIAAGATGATFSLTPLERWHWSGLATTGVPPAIYSGPIGRYRLDARAPGLPSRSIEVVIRPGETTPVAFPLQPVAASQPAPTRPTPTVERPVVKKARVPKWVWIAVGGGAVAALTMGGSKPPTVGTLTLLIPDP